MRAKGATYAEISEAVEVSSGTVGRWSKEEQWIKGFETKKAVQIAKAKAMRAKGASCKEIGEAIGMSKSTVQNWARDGTWIKRKRR